MRGQAFVVFKEQESATNAIKGVQGFALQGKPMVTNLLIYLFIIRTLENLVFDFFRLSNTRKQNRMRPLLSMGLSKNINVKD
jgi:RNA recognition motif-containing protein